MTEERFWMVWNPAGRNPTYRHRSRKGANAEARRLASANPGSKFFVLKAVGGAVAELPTVTEIKLEKPTDDLPF